MHTSQSATEHTSQSATENSSHVPQSMRDCPFFFLSLPYKANLRKKPKRGYSSLIKQSAATQRAVFFFSRL